MATSDTPATRIRRRLKDDDRNFAWLARQTHYPYKRILAEISYEQRPISLEVALAAGEALGMSLLDVAGRSEMAP